MAYGSSRSPFHAEVVRCFILPVLGEAFLLRLSTLIAVGDLSSRLSLSLPVLSEDAGSRRHESYIHVAIHLLFGLACAGCALPLEYSHLTLLSVGYVRHHCCGGFDDSPCYRENEGCFVLSQIPLGLA